jgi:hypothetical protein
MCLGPGLILWYDVSNRKGTWDLVHRRSLYRSNAVTTAARVFVRYGIDLVVVREVRWDIGSNVRADYNFSVEKETKVISWEQDFTYTTEKYQQLRQY